MSNFFLKLFQKQLKSSTNTVDFQAKDVNKIYASTSGSRREEARDIWEGSFG
jgi:hypothetical protein